jgi:hypothetical protein
VARVARAAAARSSGDRVGDGVGGIVVVVVDDAVGIRSSTVEGATLEGDTAAGPNALPIS